MQAPIPRFTQRFSGREVTSSGFPPDRFTLRSTGAAEPGSPAPSPERIIIVAVPRKLFITVLLLLGQCPVIQADPIDTSLDFLTALERADGEAVTALLSRDLRQRLQDVFAQLSVLAAENPGMLEAALSRFGDRLTSTDITGLPLESLVGRLLEGRVFPDTGLIVLENAILEGRNATVVLEFQDGGTVSFRMVWEESDWRIADSSVLNMLF